MNPLAKNWESTWCHPSLEPLPHIRHVLEVPNRFIENPQNFCCRTTLRAWALPLYSQLMAAGVRGWPPGHPIGQLPAIMIGGVTEKGSSTWESDCITMGVPESQIELIGNGRSKTVVSVDHCFVQ